MAWIIINVPASNKLSEVEPKAQVIELELTLKRLWIMYIFLVMDNIFFLAFILFYFFNSHSRHNQINYGEGNVH